MINFCTLFDSGYLSRGLAMYKSLQEHCPHFHLYILAFNDKCHEILTTLNLKNVTIISLSEFESEELLTIKQTRTHQEYCWTCTPSIIKYCIDNFKLKICIYIDADMLFYSDPSILIEEMGENSVLITEHRYSKGYDQTATSGKYCVQFVAFKNNETGQKVLNSWQEDCNNWCYARHENGKFGDQKYLDDWTKNFKGVHELQHLGGGVAPWNIQQYRLTVKQKKIQIVEIKTGISFDLVFFHFHGFSFCNNNIALLTSYALTNKQRKIIYCDYISKLQNAKEDITKIDNSFDPHAITYKDNSKERNGKNILIKSLNNFLHEMKRWVKLSVKIVAKIVTLYYLRKTIKSYNYYKYN